ncbi:hypothetical protein NQZ68_022501, partial [Dissostichus eleginoides]
MQIEGKDKDEPGNINSEIAYSIVSQEPEGTGHMFAIDSKTGQLYVKEETLETEEPGESVVAELGTTGEPPKGGGHSRFITRTLGTGTVEVRLLDINDNIPTLEKSEYDGEVEENVADVVVMRIKALDKDLPYSENWLTVFTIAKGNEDNLFSIETDKETNEGVLKLIKPVDFEELQNLELGLIVENVAPFVDGGPILMDVDVQIGEGNPMATGAGAGGGGGGGSGGVGGGGGGGGGGGPGGGGGGGPGGGGGGGPGAGPGVGPGVGPGPGVKPGRGPGGFYVSKQGVKPGTKPKPSAPAKSYPIKIAVKNVPEGPKFRPKTKNVP